MSKQNWSASAEQDRLDAYCRQAEGDRQKRFAMQAQAEQARAAQRLAEQTQRDNVRLAEARLTAETMLELERLRR